VRPTAGIDIRSFVLRSAELNLSVQPNPRRMRSWRIAPARAVRGKMNPTPECRHPGTEASSEENLRRHGARHLPQ
jgi:hypothetical protein